MKIETSWEVIVCGAGPAGIGAALSSAQCGSKTLLLESRGLVGGVSTVSPWMPVNRMLLNGETRGGIHALIVEELQALGPVASRPGRTNMIDGDGLNCHPDYLELAIYNALEKTGVEYLLDARVVGVKKNKQCVTGIIAQEKGGQFELDAQIVIDATGDGDVAAAAGVSFDIGRSQDGRHMPITLGFAVGGVDYQVFTEWFNIRENRENLFQESETNGYKIAAWYSINNSTIPNAVGVNNGGYKDAPNLDALDASDYTYARRIGLQIAIDLIDILNNNDIPGVDGAYLLRVGADLGVRDTRRIHGEYTLTLQDAESGARFDDYVARKYGAVDANQLYTGVMSSGFGYPYRCMIPKELDGLLLAGRCASATFLGHAAGKSMGNMMDLGQAAGIAASLAASSGRTIRQINAQEIREILQDRHVNLELD